MPPNRSRKSDTIADSQRSSHYSRRDAEQSVQKANGGLFGGGNWKTESICTSLSAADLNR
jgi:hypothetical protein